MAERPYLTIKELAYRWGCSYQHVRNMCVGGTIPAFRIGRIFRVKLSDVEQYECTSGSTPVQASGTPNGQMGHGPV